MCKKGLGATEWLWAGRTSDESGARYRALRFVDSQLVPGQRRTGEDRHRPRHHRTSTAHGSTSRRFVITIIFVPTAQAPVIISDFLTVFYWTKMWHKRKSFMKLKPDKLSVGSQINIFTNCPDSHIRRSIHWLLAQSMPFFFKCQHFWLVVQCQTNYRDTVGLNSVQKFILICSCNNGTICFSQASW